MNVFLYLYKTTFKNRLIKALKRPVTYVYSLLVVGYFIYIFSILGFMTTELGIDSPQGLAGVLTIFAFFFIPMNLVSYGKRKGLIFQQSDVHLLFPAPVNPKYVLIYAHVKNIFLGVVLGIALVIGGCIWFHVEIWKMILYFIFAQVIETILESSMMLIFYGIEKLKERTLTIIRYVMYGCILGFVIFGMYFLVKNGFRISTALDYLHHDYVQMFPIIGWNIAVIHLILLGPTAVNVTCSILYLVSAIILFVVAYKMECYGSYYEDAMKFAEDYAEARAKGKKGQIAIVGKRTKFNKANVTYKGSFGRAIFYRQLLEYKKSKFFIFGINTLMCAAASVLVYFMSRDAEIASSIYKPFIIPGIMAYICFVFSGYSTKWNKEMSSPYTYLIPDTAFQKLWFATLIEHIRSFVDATLFAIPAAIILKISVSQMLLSILIYVCIMAFKLYSTLMLEALLGKSLGPTAKQLLRMLLMGTFIGFGLLAAVIGTMLISLEAGYLFMITVVAAITIGFMVIASSAFEKMEAVD